MQLFVCAVNSVYHILYQIISQVVSHIEICLVVMCWFLFMASLNFALAIMLKCFIFLCTASCPNGWVIGLNKSKCFGYMRSSQSWNESETLCKGYGGHLLALTSFQELSFARSLCGEVAKGCWIGGRGINSTIGSGWKWSDNTSYWNASIFPDATVQSNCSSLSCHVNNSFDLCTLVTNGSASLVGEKCNMSHAFICMIDIGMYFVSLLS
jgi:hypothetical protein